jgi:hypothetical protein
MMKFIRKNLLAGMGVLALLVFAGGVLADDLTLLPVNPVNRELGRSDGSGNPGSSKLKAAEAALAGKNLPAFSGKGLIERVLSDGYVIGDVTLKLSPGCVFKSAVTVAASRSYFVKGSVVGYILNNKGQLAELWLLKR